MIVTRVAEIVMFATRTASARGSLLDVPNAVGPEGVEDEGKGHIVGDVLEAVRAAPLHHDVADIPAARAGRLSGDRRPGTNQESGTMPEFKMDDDAVKQMKTMIKLAKTRSVNFGISFDKGEKDLAFVTHKAKNPKSLYKEAKEASGGKNGALGEMTVEGNEIIFTCFKNPKGNCHKYVKKFLAGGNILKTVISKKIPDFRLLEESAAAASAEDRLEEDEGETIEEKASTLDTEESGAAADAEVAPAGDAEEGADADGVPDPRLPKLRAAAAQIAKRAAALPQGEARTALGVGLREVLAQIAAGEAEAALSGLKSMQEVLKAAEAQAKWEAAFARLEPAVGRALSERLVADVSTLRVRWSYAVEQANDGAYDKALATVPNIVKMLREGAAAPAAGAEVPPAAEVPKDIVAFQRSRIIWIDTKKRMMSELNKLKNAIVAQSADEEDADEFEAAGESLLANVDQIDDRLEKILEKITETPEGAKRTGLKRKAADAIKDYNAILDTPFFKAVDDNPFVQVSVTASARMSLGLIERSLG